MKIARESWVIVAIGLVDLLTTIVFIRQHGAAEANPVFQYYWKIGLPAFIGAKAVCTLGPLFILEWARQRNPRFVNKALRGAVAGYIVLYGIGFNHLNAPKAGDETLPQSYDSENARLFAASARRAEERVLLSAQGLPPVPRPLTIQDCALASAVSPGDSEALPETSEQP